MAVDDGSTLVGEGGTDGCWREGDGKKVIVEKTRKKN